MKSEDVITSRIALYTIKYQNTFSSLDKALYENKIYVNKSGSIRLTFTGTIDKLLYKEDGDKAYIVIIDYKTGNPDINLTNTVYGLDMQLPVYLYLASNMKDIKKPSTFKTNKVLFLFYYPNPFFF